MVLPGPLAGLVPSITILPSNLQSDLLSPVDTDSRDSNYPQYYGAEEQSYEDCSSRCLQFWKKKGGVQNESLEKQPGATAETRTSSPVNMGLVSMLGLKAGNHAVPDASFPYAVLGVPLSTL